MKIVVTGALGYIGSRLIRYLPEWFNSPEIVLVDNLSTWHRHTLDDLPSSASYRLIPEDILTAELDPLFSGAAAVVHLAALTDAESSLKMRDAVFRVNHGGTCRVARACARSGVPLIFASTTSVYGRQDGEVDEHCSEEDLRPQSPYAESKLSATRAIEALGQSEGLRYVICRFGTVFGVSPGMRFHTAVNKFCWQAVRGRPLTVWRAAEHQYRPYLDLVDAVRAVAFLVKRSIYDREIYNVATAHATVSEIVCLIERRMPALDVVTVDSEIMNQLSYTVSTRRFRELGFEFTGNLESGIDDTLETLRSLQGPDRSAFSTALDKFA